MGLVAMEEWGAAAAVVAAGLVGTRPASSTPSCLSPSHSQVISTARTCNLILIILDCLKPLTHKKVRALMGGWASRLVI